MASMLPVTNARDGAGGREGNGRMKELKVIEWQSGLKLRFSTVLTPDGAPE